MVPKEIKVLYHVARSKADRDNILKNGFRIGSKSDQYVKGVYTRPAAWMSKLEIKKIENGIKIELKSDQNAYDSGGDRAPYSYRGMTNNKEFREFYIDALLKIGYKIVKTKWDPNNWAEWWTTNSKEIEKCFNNSVSTKKYCDMLYDWLTKKKKCNVFINGGEVVILDVKAISKMESAG